MGQSTSTSTNSNLNADMAFLQNKLCGQLNVLNRLAFLKHSELVGIIQELNGIMKDLIDRNGKQLCFSIRKGTDSTIFWKTTIRIRCIKLNTNNNNIESSRLLTLRQFIIMHREVKDQVAMLSTARGNLTCDNSAACDNAAAEIEEAQEKGPEQAGVSVSDVKVNDFTTSVIMSSQAFSEDSTECCVCMDRKACIMLSCSHEFCEPCIDSWTRDDIHSTCPLCRSKVAGSDDAWVLTDKTEGGNYENEVKGYLVGMADREKD